MAMLWVFFALVLGDSARAASVPFTCATYATIPFPMLDCDDNEKLGREALSCVQAYYDHVQKAQGDVLKKFQAQVAKLKDQQNDSFDRTQAGYEDARKQLDKLLIDGAIARAAVDDLYLNMSFPEDYDEPETTGMSREKYLASQDCYAIPQRVMLQSQAMIDKMMNDLRATQAAMLGKQDGAQARSADVQALERRREPAHTSGQGAGTVGIGAGRSRTPASTITGVREPKPKE